MAGISDKVLKTPYAQNKYRYNGKELQNQEFSDGSGLDFYDYGARMHDPQLGRWMSPDPLSDQNSSSSCYTYVDNNPIHFIDPDGCSTEDPSSHKLSSLDIDPNLHIKKINADGDPGVYMDIGGNRTLVGFMDPDKTYKIGGTYQYYGKRDYYEKYPMLDTWVFGRIANPNDPNPDQNNDIAAKKNAVGDVLLAALLDGLGEFFDIGTSSAKGVSVIGPRDTYRQFAKQIGAKFLDVTNEEWSWRENLKFLVEVVKRGDDVIFAGKFNPNLLDPNSTLAREIKYLISSGYHWTSDYSKLVPK
jgi:RHS repeat-associated protein